MTGWKTRALQVPPVVPYKALEKFSKALYGTTGGTYSGRVFRPVMLRARRYRFCSEGYFFVFIIEVPLLRRGDSAL